MKAKEKTKKKQKKSIVKPLLGVLVVAIVVGCALVPLMQNLNFGLDLQGGFEVLYKVESIDGKKVTSDMMKSTYKTIEKRIDVLGVTEPSIVVEGDDRIRVQLAGVTDPEEARNLISQAANLTFRDTSDNLIMSSDVLKSGGAKVSQDSYGKPAVALSVADNSKFYRATKKVSEMSDNRLVIWLDFDPETDSFQTEQANCGSLSNSKCLSVATVSQGFSSDVIIQGNFKEQEVNSLVELINSGSLPTKLTEVSSKTVVASFGADSLSKTFVAGVVGVAGIVFLMCALYRFSGFIASIGLLFYTAITFLVFWLIGGVLTLPGIAALVIGIGMAVDATVISFSRIKDELYNGTKLNMAFKLGNKNSFMTIFDSNITTLISAIILFIFGESSVKGFATMLIISTIVTMVVMVFITRYLVGLFVKTGYFNDKLRAFIGIREEEVPKIEKKEKRVHEDWKNVDFVNKRKWFFLASSLMIIIGIVSLGVNGLHLGIDFKGGSSITVQSSQNLTEKALAKDIESLGYEVIETDQINDETYSIKIEDSLSRKQVLETENYFKDKYEATTDIGVVSNIVKQELVKNAIISVILASIAIVIYVSLRFTFKFAIAAIIALFHDVFMIFTVFSLFQIEVSSIFIAAVLSIIGYSINDTIVTFDRIRENIHTKFKNKLKTKEDLCEVVNISLRETLNRSLVTTFTTLIPVVSLILLGSHEIITFNLALFVGFVVGVYSSIFIASQLWIEFSKRNIGKANQKRWYEEESDEVEELTVKGINA